MMDMELLNLSHLFAFIVNRNLEGIKLIEYNSNKFIW